MLFVPDDGAGDEVDEVLGDVGHEVADAFEFSSEACDVEAVGLAAGLGAHEGDGLGEELLVELVDDLVFLDDVAGRVGVFFEDGAEESLAHEGDALAHFEEGGGPLGRLVALEVSRDLGDGAGVVGDAFEVAVDAEDEGEDAEVSRDGLLECEEAEAGLLDRDFLVVDGVVAEFERGGDGAVEAPEAVEGLLEHGDGEGGLLDDASSEGDELAIEVRPRAVVPRRFWGRGLHCAGCLRAIGLRRGVAQTVP